MREAGYGYGGIVEWRWSSWETDERAPVGQVPEKLRWKRRCRSGRATTTEARERGCGRCGEVAGIVRCGGGGRIFST